VQLSSNHESIASVVPFAADHPDALPMDLRQHEFCNCSASIFHEHERSALNVADTINLTHLAAVTIFMAGLAKWMKPS
jgi:hypothetical protein